MNLVSSRSRDDAHLRAGPFAVLGTVGVFHHDEFTDGIHSKQLSAGSSGRVVDLRSASKLNAVQKKKIFLRPSSRRGKHIAHDRVRRSDASCALRSVVY